MYLKIKYVEVIFFSTLERDHIWRDDRCMSCEVKIAHQGHLYYNMTDVLIRRGRMGTDTDGGGRCHLQGRERGLEQEAPSLLTHSSWTLAARNVRKQISVV